MRRLSASADFRDDRGVEGDTPKDRPACILVVEDDPSLREAMQIILSDAGFSVISAGRSAEVQAKLEQFRVDLVISDHRLTDGTSSDVMKTIRSVAPETPAVMMSAQLDYEQKEAARSEGFAACLLKPVDADRLEQVMRKVLAAR